MTGAHLSVRQIAKQFQGIIAVDRISFEVPANSITGLIGPNGSGKTSTMNMITGLYAADAGWIRLDDVSIDGQAPFQIARLGVARTFQNIRLLGDHTVLENVALGCHQTRTTGLLATLLNLPSQAREKRRVTEKCRELLALLGIENLAETRAASLSYGDRRRVEIARALGMRPRLLLLDEPAAGMSRAERQKLVDVIRNIRSRGISILLIEHDIELVSNTCDRIVVLNFGREIAEGTPEEIRKNPAVIEAYLGSDAHA